MVSEAASRGIGSVVWGSNHELSRAIVIEGTPPRFSQNGAAVYRWVVNDIAQIARDVCDQAGVQPADLSAVIFHQANLRIIEKVAAQLGALNAIVASDVVSSGNTSAASIPMALSKLVENRRIPGGTPVLTLGFGGGLAYAGQVIVSPYPPRERVSVLEPDAVPRWVREHRQRRRIERRAAPFRGW